MKTEEIIKNNLDFLSHEYKLKYEKKFDSGTYYTFSNKNGTFGYYEWEQFGDSEFFVKYDSIYKKIVLFEHYPKIVAEYNRMHKGFKWKFLDKRDAFWKMVSVILKEEIKNHGTIFGLKLD